jgi:hypothetical protein
MLPGRMALYVNLCAAVLIAVAVQRAAAAARDANARRGATTGAPLSWGVARVRPAVLAAGVVVAVSVLPSFPLPTDTVPVPPFFTSGRLVSVLPHRDGSVLVLPYSSDVTSTEAMVWQALAGMDFRMPEGYAMIPDRTGVTHLGPPPTALSRALREIAAGGGAPALDDASRAAFAAQLDAWRVRAVVVGPMPHRDAAVRIVTALFGCPPVAQGGVDVWPAVDSRGCLLV